MLASNSIYKYINKNGKLPNYVTISGYKYSMSEFMYILSKTITYKYNKITSSIKVKYDVKNPSKASGNSIKGTISSKTYYSYAKNIVTFIEKNNQAPNFVTSSLGKIQYQTAIFGLNKVLNYIYVKGKLPSSLSFNVRLLIVWINIYQFIMEVLVVHLVHLVQIVVLSGSSSIVAGKIN